MFRCLHTLPIYVFPLHSVTVPGTHTGSCRTPFRSHEWIEAKGAQPKALWASSEIVHSKINDLLISSSLTDPVPPAQPLVIPNNTSAALTSVMLRQHTADLEEFTQFVTNMNTLRSLFLDNIYNTLIGHLRDRLLNC